MPRVARRREAGKPNDPVADDVDVLLRHGHELSPQVVEGVAVEPARARLEPARVDDVRRADLRHVDGERGMLSNEGSRRAGVVQVDVREEQVLHVAELDAAPPEGVVQGREAACRPAVEEGQAVIGLDEVGADPALVAAMEQVEWLVAHAATVVGLSVPRWRGEKVYRRETRAMTFERPGGHCCDHRQGRLTCLHQRSSSEPRAGSTCTAPTPTRRRSSTVSCSAGRRSRRRRASAGISSTRRTARRLPDACTTTGRWATRMRGESIS